MAGSADLTFEKMMARISGMKPDDVFYPRYAFKSEEELKQALTALNARGVKTVGFSNKEPLGTPSSRNEDDYFTSYHQLNYVFTQEQAEWLTKNLGLIPKVETLDVSGCKIGDENAAALLCGLKNTNITELHLENTALTSAVSPAFEQGLPLSNVKKLFIGNNYTLKDDGLAALAAVLPETRIEHLDLRQSNASGQTSVALASALPKSQVTSLNLCHSCIGDMKTLLAALPETKVVDLDLSHIRHSEQAALVLTEALPALPLKRLRYDIWHTFSDDFFDKTAAALRDPRCRLEQPYLGVEYAKKENAEKIVSACEFLKNNAAYRLAIARKTKDNAAQTSVPQGTGLIDALESGLLRQALAERPPLTAAECLREKDGVSLVAAASRAEELGLLFSPANWNNAKEYAAAWEKVPPEHRWQMDGKNGRPSFSKNKNEVMKKAVLAMVGKNKTR